MVAYSLVSNISTSFHLPWLLSLLLLQTKIVGGENFQLAHYFPGNILQLYKAIVLFQIECGKFHILHRFCTSVPRCLKQCMNQLLLLSGEKSKNSGSICQNTKSPWPSTSSLSIPIALNCTCGIVDLFTARIAESTTPIVKNISL